MRTDAGDQYGRSGTSARLQTGAAKESHDVTIAQCVTAGDRTRSVGTTVLIDITTGT